MLRDDKREVLPRPGNSNVVTKRET